MLKIQDGVGIVEKLNWEILVGNSDLTGKSKRKICVLTVVYTTSELSHWRYHAIEDIIQLLALNY